MSIEELGGKGQMSAEQYLYIYKLIKDCAPCRVLVFGCGNDSRYWIEANKDGRTVFLEDSERWIRKVQPLIPKADIRKVTYTTTKPDYLNLLDTPEKLHLELPEDIQGKWDIILVDAPKGFKDHHHGRMQSIYAASRMGTDILIHDCQRMVEDLYGKLFCGDLIYEIKGGSTLLRHYLKNIKWN